MTSVVPTSPYTDTDDLPWVDPEYDNGEHLEPGARARCLDCRSTLIAKCGEINRWHWAHQGDAICVGDGEGAWHLAWKHWAQNQSATVELVTHPHRADIAWPDGRIWELQTNYTDAATIRKREDHYGDQLTWIYRWLPGRFNRLRNIGDGWFKWNRPAPSMAMHERPVIWHHLDRLYEVTTRLSDGEVHIRFARGESDRYGPVLYGSQPAPFHVGEAVDALDKYQGAA
jgi:hypothetical protein